MQWLQALLFLALNTATLKHLAYHKKPWWTIYIFPLDRIFFFCNFLFLFKFSLPSHIVIGYSAIELLSSLALSTVLDSSQVLSHVPTIAGTSSQLVKSDSTSPTQPQVPPSFSSPHSSFYLVLKFCFDKKPKITNLFSAFSCLSFLLRMPRAASKLFLFPLPSHLNLLHTRPN